MSGLIKIFFFFFNKAKSWLFSHWFLKFLHYIGPNVLVLAQLLSHVWLCKRMNCSPTRSSVHRISQARIVKWVVISFSRGSSWPRDHTHVSDIAGAFFTIEPPGKSKGPSVEVKVTRLYPTPCDPMGQYSPWNSPDQNTRVGSHSLLQGIFPIQGLSPGLPHCRWILYHCATGEAPTT